MKTEYKCALIDRKSTKYFFFYHFTLRNTQRGTGRERQWQDFKKTGNNPKQERSDKHQHLFKTRVRRYSSIKVDRRTYLLLLITNILLTLTIGKYIFCKPITLCKSSINGKFLRNLKYHLFLNIRYFLKYFIFKTFLGYFMKQFLGHYIFYFCCYFWSVRFLHIYN